jgi:hypothetical protein
MVCSASLAVDQVASTVALEHDGLGLTVAGWVVGGCVIGGGGGGGGVVGGSVVGDVVVAGGTVAGAVVARAGPWHAANSTMVAADATTTTARIALTTTTPNPARRPFATICPH